MHTLRTLLSQQKQIITTTPDASVREAAKEMARANVGAVAILEGDRLVGLFTERDVLKRVLLRDLKTDQVRVREVMTVEIITARPEQEVWEARRIMREHHIRHLPVLADDGKLLGVLSLRDLMQDEMAEIRRYLALEEG